MDITKKIEALLFYKNEPVSISHLATTLTVSEEEISDALKQLSTSLTGHGICLIQNGSEVMLATTPDVSELIEAYTKEELSKDLGKAGLETLTIILYKGPVSRRDVDYIRGVNSNFILRNLLVRGLIERVEKTEGERGYLYQPTFELLQYMGIKNCKELPEFESVTNNIDTALSAIEESDKQGSI